MKKNLSKGDNHLSPSSRKFVGAEVDASTYERFRRAARDSRRSVSGLIRWLMDHADDILSSDSSDPKKNLPEGDNHLPASKPKADAK